MPDLAPTSVLIKCIHHKAFCHKVGVNSVETKTIMASISLEPNLCDLLIESRNFFTQNEKKMLSRFSTWLETENFDDAQKAINCSRAEAC